RRLGGSRADDAPLRATSARRREGSRDPLPGRRWCGGDGGRNHLLNAAVAPFGVTGCTTRDYAVRVLEDAHFPRVLVGRRLRFLAVAGATAVLAAAAITAVRFEPANASSSFVPTADSDVSSSSPTRNYGTATTLRVRLASSGATYRTFMRFTVSGLVGTVSRVQLRLYVTDPTTGGGRVYQTGTTWTETGITW